MSTLNYIKNFFLKNGMELADEEASDKINRMQEGVSGHSSYDNCLKYHGIRREENYVLLVSIYLEKDATDGLPKARAANHLVTGSVIYQSTPHSDFTYADQAMEMLRNVHQSDGKTIVDVIERAQVIFNHVKDSLDIQKILEKSKITK